MTSLPLMPLVGRHLSNTRNIYLGKLRQSGNCCVRHSLSTLIPDKTREILYLVLISGYITPRWRVRVTEHDTDGKSWTPIDLLIFNGLYLFHEHHLVHECCFRSCWPCTDEGCRCRNSSRHQLGAITNCQDWKGTGRNGQMMPSQTVSAMTI